MKPWITSILVVAIGCGTAGHAAAQIDDVADQRVIRVMTRNVYHGVDAEIFDVPNATTLPELLVKVAPSTTATLRETSRPGLPHWRPKSTRSVLI